MLDGFAVGIQAGVELPDDLHQFDRSHVVYGRGPGMVPDFRRIARQWKHVPNAQCRHAHQLALEADDVAIAAAQVEQGSDALLLQRRADREIADAQNRQ